MAKKILLFADGTGNAVTTQESNIWRIYQSLDPTATDQIAYYIPGVGTSGFKPYAIFDGATGVGVPDNVLKLYRFLSWNWSAGDEIYMFGFSRGAFTIRVLVDLIHSQGLQPTEIGGVRVSTEEMRRNARAAWKEYKRNDNSRLQNLWVWLKRLGRRSGQAPKGENIAITFVGLFDTVEAFGVPIEELREAINVFFAPISFGEEQTISPQVAFVRHALSIDDERISFHPIRIDQSREAPTRPGRDKRVQEVWFAGVHSDIGGGYADDAIAYTALVWMLEEAQRLAPAGNPLGQGLILKAGALDDLRSAASSYAPLHDSRSGAAVLYRYDPRSFGPGDTQRFGETVVHHSVAERIQLGSDAYAPVVLPSDAKFLVPNRSIYKYVEDGVNGWIEDAPPSTNAPPGVKTDLALRQNKAVRVIRSLAKPNGAILNLALDYVWRRRVNYLSLITLLLLFVSLPLTGEALAELIDDHFGAPVSRFPGGLLSNLDAWTKGLFSALSGVAELILSITPSYLAPFVRAVIQHPIISGLLAAAIWGHKLRSDMLEETIHDYARSARRLSGGGARATILSRLARAVRTNAVTAWIHRQSSELVLPFVYTIAIVAALAAVSNRLWFNYLVGSGKICYPTKASKLAWLGATAEASRPGYSSQHPDGFAVNNPCWASGFAVERGAAYRLTIDIDAKKGDEPWLDQLIMTDVNGFDSFTLATRIGTIFRRWPFVAWFHPIARIGAEGAVEWPLAPIEGDAPLSGRKGKCTGLPRSYAETRERQEYCAAQPDPAACLELPKRLPLGEALPRAELAAASKVWEARSFDFEGKACLSIYPRRTLVSDFVAEETGELFLFVNDAVFFPWDSTPQSFYTNNTGTATVTLRRAPLAAEAATAEIARGSGSQ